MKFPSVDQKKKTKKCFLVRICLNMNRFGPANIDTRNRFRDGRQMGWIGTESVCKEQACVKLAKAPHRLYCFSGNLTTVLVFSNTSETFKEKSSTDRMTSKEYSMNSPNVLQRETNTITS